MRCMYYPHPHPTRHLRGIAVGRILCSNRDEFLERRTAPAHFHSFESTSGPTVDEGLVLSGRDLQAGGTWQGLSRAGRVAFL